jgi:hypothetical protein
MTGRGVILGLAGKRSGRKLVAASDKPKRRRSDPST